MRRHLQLKREVLVALDANELKEVSGGSLTSLNDLIAKETILCEIGVGPTEVECDKLTRYYCNSAPICW